LDRPKKRAEAYEPDDILLVHYLYASARCVYERQLSHEARLKPAFPLSANACLWHGIQAHWEYEPNRLADTLLCLEFVVLDELRYIRFAQAAAN